MQSLIRQAYGLLLLILLLTGMELFSWYYLYQNGYVQQLISSDQSKVSILILVIYFLATLYFIYIGKLISEYLLELHRYGFSQSRHISMQRLIDQWEEALTPQQNKQLLEVLDTRVRSTYAFGFLVADMMLKLGLLGTVIGFIIMLGSLSNLNSIDITVMQTLLAEMSGGMKVALFTTLTGLLTGIALNLKFNLIDWSVDHLLNDVQEQMLKSSRSV